jgi:rubrerythrin
VTIAPKVERNAKIRADYAAGATMQSLASEHQISRSRVQQIVHGMKGRYSRELGKIVWTKEPTVGRSQKHKVARLNETERYNVDQARLEAAETAAEAALEEWRRLSKIATELEQAFNNKWNPDFHRALQRCPVCGRQ